MFHIRTDDCLIVGMASFLLQALVTVWELGESKKILPPLLGRAREKWRTNRLLWLLLVSPCVLASIAAIWLLLRVLIPENDDQTLKIFCIVFVVSMSASLVRLHFARKAVKVHTERALQHIESVEEELKKLTKGPVIEDEQVDQQVLSIKKKLAQARETLGIKNNDPNDM